MNTNGAGNALQGDISQESPIPLRAEEAHEEKYVHPESKALLSAVPFFRHVPIVGPATQTFGPKCVVSLGAVYVLNKGVANKIIRYSLYPMFMKRFGVTSSVFQRMSSISSMGWSVKPLAALLSDTVALFGYTKRWYLALSCLLGGACALGYGLLPETVASASIAPVFIFATNFCMANVDVLSEGHYSRLVRQYPGPGADLISWVWGVIVIGQIIAAAIQGPISDSGRPEIGVFISAAIQVFCVGFFVVNWYGERPNRACRIEDHLFITGKGDMPNKGNSADAEDIQLAKLEMEMVQGRSCSPLQDHLLEDVAAGGPAKPEDASVFLPTRTCCSGMCEVNTEVLFRNTRVMAYGLLMTMGTISMLVLTMVGSTYQLLYGLVTIAILLCAFGFYALPLMVAKANLFSYIQLASYLSIPGALDTFYMADANCLPDGPNFTQTFHSTVGGFVGNSAAVVGVYLFSSIFSKCSYRLTFFVTTIILVVGSVFDLVLVERWNRPVVSDKVLFLVGDSIVYEICVMLNYMPMNILIARLCPKGSESTMFAILAAFSNLGQSTSSAIGAILMETVWPVHAEAPCDFSNVKWLVIVGHLLMPLICLPLVFILIPSGRVCDALVVEVASKGKDVPTTSTTGTDNNNSGSGNGGKNEPDSVGNECPGDTAPDAQHKHKL